MKDHTVETRQQSSGAPAGRKKGGSLISDNKLKQLYATMLHSRISNERAHLRPTSSKLPGNRRAAIGQEATVVGLALDLRPGDTLVASRRDGLSIDSLNKVQPAVPFTGISGRLGMSAGIALANRNRKSGAIVVAFCGGDSGASECWREAFHLAGTDKLPIIFVVGNDGRARSGREKNLTLDLCAIAEACGFPGITVDGNDVVAVYRVAFECISRARQGGGPTLIEAATYRTHDHPAPDSSLNSVLSRDPIHHMEKYLANKGLFSEEWKQRVLGKIQKELDAGINVGFSEGDAESLPPKSAR